jgi:hypothetical protein
MKNTPWLLGLTLGALACARPQVAPPAPATMTGRALYFSNCVACHGPGGHGDGPLADRIPVLPPDLTRIASRNDGHFPFERVRRAIDGRTPIASHGAPGMPRWGDALLEPLDGYDPGAAQGRVEALTRYLATLQVAD